MGFLDSAVSALFTSKRPKPFTTEGTGGTYSIGGFLNTPEKNHEVASPYARFRKYDEIVLNTAIVATGVRYYSSLISGVGWTLQPSLPGNRESEQMAERIDKMKDAMDVPWYRVVRRCAGFKWKGFSLQEWIARRMDEIEPGLIGIGSVEDRPQVTVEQWDLEPQSNYVRGFIQRDPGTGELYPLARSKCIYLVDDTLTGSPDGVGLLRHVVELASQLKRLEQLEGWAYETDLRGVPVGYAPTSILDDLVKRNVLTRADADKKLKGLNDFITNHIKNPQLGLLLDSGVYTGQDQVKTPSGQKLWGLELVRGDSEGLKDIHIAIERKQHEMARVLGIEQFMLGGGTGGKGSLALSEDKSANLTQLINATITEVSWCLNTDYLDPLFTLNKWDKKLKPKLIPDAVQLRSVTEIVDALQKLSMAGAALLPSDPVVNQIRSMLHLVEQPEIPPEVAGQLMRTRLLGPPKAPPPGGGKAPPDGKPGADTTSPDAAKKAA